MTEPLDLEALRLLAESATPGPWSVNRDDCEYTVRPDLDWEAVVAEACLVDASYIAACSPDRILGMIQRLKLLALMEEPLSPGKPHRVADEDGLAWVDTLTRSAQPSTPCRLQVGFVRSLLERLRKAEAARDTWRTKADDCKARMIEARAANLGPEERSVLDSRVEPIAQAVLSMELVDLTEGQAVERTGLARVEVRTLGHAMAALLRGLQYEGRAGVAAFCSEKQGALRQVLRCLVGDQHERELQAHLGYDHGEQDRLVVCTPGEADLIGMTYQRDVQRVRADAAEARLAEIEALIPEADTQEATP